MNTLVVSAFHGTGKSYCSWNSEKYKILDSHFGRFGRAHFPDNWIEHIKNNIGKVDFIFVSSQELVRNALTEANIPFMLIYPNINLKDEYIKRCQDRGSDQAFIDRLDKKWDTWITKLGSVKHNESVVLDSNRFISDIIDILKQ